MAQKHINYIKRDFDSIKNEIIDYSKTNYPQLSDNFGNDSSISSWLIDLMSNCVDSLNYHIDRVFQNTQINSTSSRASLMNMARVNGLKVPGPKAGLCEVKFSCVLPAGYIVDGSVDISQPNWNAAPIIQRNCVVSAGKYQYTIDENVDFREQFNSNAYSNRTYTPRKNSNGQVTGYTVSKTVLATAGSRKVYKKTLSSSDVKPFMEVLLPDTDVMNIESIIFKPVTNINTNPQISEYYIDEEEYQFQNSPLTTYRFFEVDSLSDQWRWGTEMSKNGFSKGIVLDKYSPEMYVDYTETMSGTASSQRTTRIYRGGWKPLRQKFITEYTDNGYMKIIFGPGVDYNEYPSDATTFSQYRMAAMINNDMLGVMPKIGWTMFVLYTTGGGVETNIAAGAINTIQSYQIDFPSASKDESITNTLKSEIMRSMTVTNTTNGVTGKDAPSNEELKYFIKYNTGTQNRCVTLKDYKVRVMQMPPKYGAPFRCSVIEENNKIVLSVLNIDANGSLYKALPSTLVDNMVDYLGHYKSLNDYVEIKSGKIYNIGFLIDAFIDKTYNSADVIANIISTVKEYMDINKQDMGGDIFLGDLNKEIGVLDGVISLISLRAYKINGGGYSNDKCPLPSIEDTETSTCNSVEEPSFLIDNATVERIDLDSLDSVLIGDANAMYQIKNADVDIRVRIKQR